MQCGPRVNYGFVVGVLVVVVGCISESSSAKDESSVSFSKRRYKGAVTDILEEFLKKRKLLTITISFPKKSSLQLRNKVQWDRKTKSERESLKKILKEKKI